ncbi:MAG: hypothetical protein KDC00_03890 [Flavobacteriales bacterium]|nr:hypothetical protein [Flavobacteriales bacterium]
MKKFLTLLAFAGFMSAASAQTTTTEAPKKEDAAKVEKTHSCADHAKSADGKNCCAGKGDAKASATDSKDGMKAAGCCASKSSTKGCDHAKAEAGDGHGHEHAEMKEHACTDACKDDAHVYACGEKGHTCAADCHAKH